MTAAPQRPCKRPGCRAFAVAGGFCGAHEHGAKVAEAAKLAAVDVLRGSAHTRGYDAKWAAVSREQRTRFPFSAGYLTRTPYWTRSLAEHFHALRAEAVVCARYSSFYEPEGAGALLLAEFPIYEFHASDRIEPSQVTDHIIPHEGDPVLFWAEWNLQPISKRQHDEKTATYDGGFRGRHTAPLSPHRITTPGGIA